MTIATVTLIVRILVLALTGVHVTRVMKGMAGLARVRIFLFDEMLVNKLTNLKTSPKSRDIKIYVIEGFI